MGTPRLLIADDEDSIHEFVSRTLENEDLRIDHAMDGHEALRLSSGNPYDVIITDLVMPLKDGLSLVQLLRARGYRMPIIVMSGYITGDIRMQLLNIEDVSVLQKPVRPADLVRTVRTLLKPEDAT